MICVHCKCVHSVCVGGVYMCGWMGGLHCSALLAAMGCAGEPKLVVAMVIT